MTQGVKQAPIAESFPHPANRQEN